MSKACEKLSAHAKYTKSSSG